MGDIFLLCSNFAHADEPYMQKLLFHLSKSVSGEVSSDSDSLTEYASKEWYDRKKKLLPMNWKPGSHGDTDGTLEKF